MMYYIFCGLLPSASNSRRIIKVTICPLKVHKGLKQDQSNELFLIDLEPFLTFIKFMEIPTIKLKIFQNERDFG